MKHLIFLNRSVANYKGVIMSKNVSYCTMCSKALTEKKDVCNGVLCNFLNDHDWVKCINRSAYDKDHENKVHIIVNYNALKHNPRLREETLRLAKEAVDRLDPEHNEYWKSLDDKGLLGEFKCSIWPHSCVNFNHMKLNWQEWDDSVYPALQYIDKDDLNSILDVCYPGEVTQEVLDLCDQYRKRVNEMAVDHLIHVDESVNAGEDFKLVCCPEEKESKECEFNRYDGFTSNYHKMQRFCDNIRKKHSSERIIVSRKE